MSLPNMEELAERVRVTRTVEYALDEATKDEPITILCTTEWHRQYTEQVINFKAVFWRTNPHITVRMWEDEKDAVWSK